VTHGRSASPPWLRAVLFGSRLQHLHPDHTIIEEVCVCVCGMTLPCQMTWFDITSHLHLDQTMGWLRLVGSLKLQVSFAKEPYKTDDILQKRPMIWRGLPIVATPYYLRVCVCVGDMTLPCQMTWFDTSTTITPLSKRCVCVSVTWRFHITWHYLTLLPRSHYYQKGCGMCASCSLSIWTDITQLYELTLLIYMNWHYSTHPSIALLWSLFFLVRDTTHPYHMTHCITHCFLCVRDTTLPYHMTPLHHTMIVLGFFNHPIIDSVCVCAWHDSSISHHTTKPHDYRLFFLKSNIQAKIYYFLKDINFKKIYKNIIYYFYNSILTWLSI